MEDAAATDAETYELLLKLKELRCARLQVRTGAYQRLTARLDHDPRASSKTSCTPDTHT